MAIPPMPPSTIPARRLGRRTDEDLEEDPGGSLISLLGGDGRFEHPAAILCHTHIPGIGSPPPGLPGLRLSREQSTVRRTGS